MAPAASSRERQIAEGLSKGREHFFQVSPISYYGITWSNISKIPGAGPSILVSGDKALKLRSELVRVAATTHSAPRLDPLHLLLAPL